MFRFFFEVYNNRAVAGDVQGNSIKEIRVHDSPMPSNTLKG